MGFNKTVFSLTEVLELVKDCIRLKMYPFQLPPNEWNSDSRKLCHVATVITGNDSVLKKRKQNAVRFSPYP